MFEAFKMIVLMSSSGTSRGWVYAMRKIASLTIRATQLFKRLRNCEARQPTGSDMLCDLEYWPNTTEWN